MQTDPIKFSDRFFHLPISQDFRVQDSDGIDLKLLEGLSQVNIFVGPNNSGKSRFIRELIRNPISPYFFSGKITTKIQDIVYRAIDEVFSIIQNKMGFPLPRNTDFSFETANFTFSQNFFSELLKFRTDKKYDIGEKLSHISDFKQKMPHNSTFTIRTPQGVKNFLGDNTIGQNILQIIIGLEEDLTQFQFNGIYARIYIPAIRSLKRLSANPPLTEKLSKEYKLEFYADIGRRRTEIVQNEKTYKSIELQTGEDFYLYVDNAKNSGDSEEERIKEFEVFLSETFFENKSVQLKATRYGIDELSIRIGNEEQRPIFNLGDGLQMLINLTFPLFNFDCGIIAIEEPELFIHPGLQKKLLEVFITHPKSKNFVFLIATHSNHFLDSALPSSETSIFTVAKKLLPQMGTTREASLIQVSKVAHQSNNALNLLGVSNSSVYLSNSTIWVEGITDKLYISKFLSAYMEKYSTSDVVKKFSKAQEGIHYSYVLSGGSTIVHWNFEELAEYDNNEEGKIITKKFCGSALVIVDSDYKKNPNQKLKLENQLGMRFIELNVPEIENLLSYQVIKQSIKCYSTCSQINDQEFTEPSAKEFRDYKIGSLIETIILKNVTVKTSRKKFATLRTGMKKVVTVNDKVGFCHKSLPFINSQNLNLEAESLCEKIIDFVISNNSSL